MSTAGSSVSPPALTGQPPNATPGAYRLGDRDFARADPGFEPALALAYASRLRPRCLCRPEGVEMYVSKLAQHYVLKRMPMTAHRHADHCVARHGVVAIEAAHDFRDPAVREDDEGILHVSIDVPLDRRAACAGSMSLTASASAEGGPPAWRRHRFTLSELVDYLWKAADLDWWHPRFEGRRSWAVVRALLRRALHDKFIGGHPMATRVFIPEPFQVEHQAAIAERRHRQWLGTPDPSTDTSIGTIAGRSGSPPTDRHQDGRRQILVAEVKEIGARRGTTERAVTMRHLPDVPCLISERQWQYVSRVSAVPLRLWTEGEVPHLLCAAMFDPTPDRPQHLHSLTLLPATDQWQLVTGPMDVDRLRRLVHLGRPFSAAAHGSADCPATSPAGTAIDLHRVGARARAAPHRRGFATRRPSP